MKTASRLEGTGEYYFSQKLREIDAMNRSGKNVINLGIGSPDLPPHPEVIKVLQEESAKPANHSYQSYKGSPVLRNAISEWYKKCFKVELNADTEILPLMGSKEGIMHICMTYLNEGDQVLIPNPGYPTYLAAATISGAECIGYDLTKENKWFPDFKALEKMDLSKVRLMFAGYPHMPTGQGATKELFVALVAFVKKFNILLVHDNPYSFILPGYEQGKEPLSLLQIEGAKDYVVELNSLSKSHNMAGWRIGMLCGAKEKIADVLRFKSNMDSGMFLPIQLAAAKALQLNAGWYMELNKLYNARREKVYELLNLLDCVFEENQAGLFVWASVSDRDKDGYALSDMILQKSNVFITPGGIFGSNGNNYIRVSLCASEEKITESITRIKQTL